MKKILVLALSAIMITTALVGCSSKKDKGENALVSKSEIEGTTQYFGRVKNVTGNEIEVELAGYDEFLEAEEEYINELNKEEGGKAQMTDTTAPISSDDAAAIDNNSVGGVELEFTGETKSFTIPAGSKVVSLITQKEAPVTDVKKGSILIINAKDNADSSTASVVSILQ